jgi:P pilus assembly chaperone PapD
MKLIRLLPLFVLGTCLPPASADVSFGVDHTELVTDLVAGTTRTLRFNVDNPGTETVPFTVYAEDFEIANGSPVFSKKSGARSLAARITPFPASFELKPGEVREVTLTLDAGAGPFTPGSYYAAIFVQSSRLSEPVPAGKDRTSRINLVRRLGLYVFANHQPEAQPLPPDVAITAITRTAEGVALKLKNPSPYMRSVGSGSLQLTALSGGQPHAIVIRPFRLLPETETTIDLPVPAKIKLGDTNVLAAVDYGAEELLVGEQRMKF